MSVLSVAARMSAVKVTSVNSNRVVITAASKSRSLSTTSSPAKNSKYLPQGSRSYMTFDTDGNLEPGSMRYALRGLPFDNAEHVNMGGLLLTAGVGLLACGAVAYFTGNKSAFAAGPDEGSDTTKKSDDKTATEGAKSRGSEDKGKKASDGGKKKSIWQAIEDKMNRSGAYDDLTQEDLDRLAWIANGRP